MIDRKDRIMSAVVDVFNASAFGLILSIIISLLSIQDGEVNWMNDYGYYLPVIFLVLKDVLGLSLGKRFNNLKIVRADRAQVKLKDKLFRNLTLVFYPIEGLFAIINPDRRIGDYLAKTKLDYRN